MKFNMMVPIRIIQGLFALVVISLSGFVAHWYDSTMVVSSPSQLNFLIFGGVWSLLSLAYISVIPRFFPKASNSFIAFGVEVSNVLFWFAGFVALAVFLSKLFLCHGPICHSAHADVIFAALSFAIWTASAVLQGMDLFKTGFRQRAPVPAPMKETA